MAFVKLHQNIDTLKYHLYPSNVATSHDIEGYNSVIDKLLSMKMSAQTKRNENKTSNDLQHDFKGFSFRVKPSTVKGFSVSVENADLTIHLKKLVITADQSPFSKVEFRASFLQRCGYMKAVQIANSFLKNNIISAFTIKISEIHLQCDVQGYTFTQLDYHRIKTRARNNRVYDEMSGTDSKYFSGKRFQGFMLGSGDYLMRLYNKTNEIKKFPNKAFIEGIWRKHPHYDENMDVFRIEFQLRREKLKNMVINDQVLDGFEVILNNLNNIWGRCLDDFSMRDLDNKKCIDISVGFVENKDTGVYEPLSLETVRTWFKRSNLHPLWLTISTFNGHAKTDTVEIFRAPFTDNFLYVHNAFKAFLSTTLSHYGNILPSTIEDAMNSIEDYTQRKHELTVIQDVYSKRLDRFNKLEKITKDDEKLYQNKHQFVNRVFDHIEHSYDEMYHWDVAYDANDYFIKKFQNFLGEAV